MDVTVFEDEIDKRLPEFEKKLAEEIYNKPQVLRYWFQYHRRDIREGVLEAIYSVVESSDDPRKNPDLYIYAILDRHNNWYYETRDSLKKSKIHDVQIEICFGLLTDYADFDFSDEEEEEQ